MDSETSDLLAPSKETSRTSSDGRCFYICHQNLTTFPFSKKDCACGHCYSNSQFHTIEMFFFNGFLVLLFLRGRRLLFRYTFPVQTISVDFSIVMVYTV
jgi:hypothetical protein